MSSVGGVGGAGGGGAAGGAGGVGGVGGAAGGSSVGAAEGASAVGAVESGSNADTTAVEQTGGGGDVSIFVNQNMSTQDWCSLRTQAAEPVQESPEIDLKKMMEWLMAIKLLEAMNKNQ